MPRGALDGCVWAYLDESGTHHGAPALIFGGAIAKRSAWSRCERELRDLFKRNGLEAFHATDVRPPRRSFKGWSPSKLKAFVLELVALIFKRCAYCVTVACTPTDYVEIYESADTPRTPRKDTLYGLCFRMTMLAMIDFISDKPWSWPLDVVLEHGHKHSGDALRIFDELKRATPPHMLGEMALKGKKDCELLAIPDALVHSIFKAKSRNPVVTPAAVQHEITIGEAVPREPTLQARFHSFTLTRDSLNQLVDAMRVKSPKQLNP